MATIFNNPKPYDIQTPNGGAAVINDQTKPTVKPTPTQVTQPVVATPVKTSSNPTTVSNTTINKQVPSIIQTSQNYSNNGITTDANGVMHYANGDIYTPAIPGTPAALAEQQTSQNYVSAPSTKLAPNTYIDYSGNTRTLPPDTNIPEGVTLTPDNKGNYIGSDGKQYASPTGDTSYTDKQISENNDKIKAASDAAMADAINSIQKNYENYINQQTQTNAGQLAGTRNALLMGGAMGQGSSAQFAPISSQNILAGQIQYGQQQIIKLQNERDALISSARLADYSTANGVRQLNDINKQLQKNREEQVSIAKDLNDKIVTQNQKLADTKAQSDKDNAIADEVSAGNTDAATIIKNLRDKGITVTAKEVKDTLDNIVTTNGTDISNFSGETKNFMALKNLGQLPSSITKLPEGQQLAAYLQMIRSIETAPAGGSGTVGTYVAGANPTVDAWAERIQNGSAKITDIPATQAGLRNQVTVALQAMGNSLDGKPTTTELGKAALTDAKGLMDKFNERKGTLAVGGSRFWGAGGLRSAIPGTPERDFVNDFDSIKSKLSLEGVKYLKGQGQVSDAERALLAQAVTKLNLSQSESEFKKTLQSIIDKLEGNVQKEPIITDTSHGGVNLPEGETNDNNFNGVTLPN